MGTLKISSIYDRKKDSPTVNVAPGRKKRIGEVPPLETPDMNLNGYKKTQKE